MQKKLIALAVAGLISAPAMAQSNVTIYGVVDAGFVYGKGDDNKFKGIESGLLSASRIGLKGVEDLGNGLKAKFVLEYGINVDEGSGPTGARQSWVGLESGFGFVGLGRQYSPGHNYAGMLDNFNSSAGFNPLGKLVSINLSDILPAGVTLPAGISSSIPVTSIYNGGNGRWNNSISYKSPNFSGFDVQAMYAFGESADQADDIGFRDYGDRFGIGAGYRNAGLKAALVYHNTEGGGSTSSAPFIKLEDIKEWMAGVGYDFGVVDVNLTYTDIDNVAGADFADAQMLYLNAGIPVGTSGKVLLGYAQHKVDYSGIIGDLIGDQKVKSWSLAYTHGLSKRTTAYAGYTYVDNDDFTWRSAAPGLKGELIDSNGNLSSDSSSALMVGLRHTF